AMTPFSIPFSSLRNTNMKKMFIACAIVWCVSSLVTLRAQAPAAEPPAAPAAQAAAAPAAAPVAITDADLKGVAAPKPEDRAAGDPGGTLTGTVGDIPVSDAKK